MNDVAVYFRYEAELQKLVDQLAWGLKSARVATRRSAAWSILALLAGGVTLSRARQSAEVGNQIARTIIESVLRFS